MKYTIPAIDQRAALALGDIDLIDCHLLQWLFYFCNSKSPALERSQHGTWVNYEFLSSEMPLLGLKQTAVGERIRQLQTKGYITLHTNKGVRKTYVGLTERIERLFGDEPNHANGLEGRQTSTMVSPNHANGLAQGSAKPSGWSDQSHNNPSHKLSGKTDHKGSSVSQPEVDRSDEANPTKVAMRLARERGLKPWEAGRQSSILRRSSNEASKVEPGKDPQNSRKPVKRHSNEARRGNVARHADKQLATAQV